MGDEKKLTLADYTLAGAFMPRPDDERTLTMQAVDLWEIANALEADNKEGDRLLLAAALKYTGLEAKLSKMEEENVILMHMQFPFGDGGWCCGLRDMGVGAHEAGCRVAEALAGGDEVSMPEPCQAVIYHGPGHQSKTKCQKEQPHVVHSARYGSMDQYAEWVGDAAHSDYFDAPPSVEALAGGEEA